MKTRMDYPYVSSNINIGNNNIEKFEKHGAGDET